jgi:hypothetical protein
MLVLLILLLLLMMMMMGVVGVGVRMRMVVGEMGTSGGGAGLPERGEASAEPTNHLNLHLAELLELAGLGERGGGGTLAFASRVRGILSGAVGLVLGRAIRMMMMMMIRRRKRMMRMRMMTMMVMGMMAGGTR